jgi:hypothetical protein
LEHIRTLSNVVNDRDAAFSIIANIDGGHIKSKGVGRSFEAMIANVYRPENIKKLISTTILLQKSLQLRLQNLTLNKP